MSKLRIATWNINGMNARLDYICRWLDTVQPDIVGLQELKMVDEKFPHEVFKELGYHAVTHGQKSWNGVAILSKKKAKTLQVGLPGQDDFGARMLSAKVAGLTYIVVYCPNGKTVAHPDFEKKLAWFDALRDYVAENHKPTEPVVLCGDFNIVPAPIDSWNEKMLHGGIFHTEVERSKIQAFSDVGLIDLWREHRPTDPGHTWWDYRAGAFFKRWGLRIDLIMGTEPVSKRVRDSFVERAWRKKVDGLTPSDHAPVWIDLK